MKNTGYLLVISEASVNILKSMSEIRRRPEFAELQLLVLTNNPKKQESLEGLDVPIRVVACQFSTYEEIAEALRPFKGDIRAVVCRGDKNIQYLREVVPHLPAEVLVATPHALEAATDKRLMREAFLRHAPTITPQFVQVRDGTDAEVARVEAKLQYPVIVKPANLASSLLIQACYSRSELAKALNRVFEVIGKIYQQQGRTAPPQVIVEEFMEGDFYSVDSYVMKPGEFFHCPVVGYVPAKQLGIDDFFLYKRFLPSELPESEVAAAKQTIEKALTAVGLTHSSAHVEMLRTRQGWKIIEIGPRLGRFRHIMYREAYGIDHSLNDLLIHLGEKPIIPGSLLKHCNAYSIYPHSEGTLREITGLEDVEQNNSTVFLRVFAEKGAACVHAKNGGGALAEFVIANQDPEVFSEAAQFVEGHVEAIVE